MISLTFKEAEKQFKELLYRAENGEKVILTRAGKAIVQITPIHKKRKPFPFTELAKFRASQPLHAKPSLEDVQAIRQEARY